MKSLNTFLVGVAMGLVLGILLLAVQGCGPIKTENKVSGTIVHEVKLNLDNLEQYFAIECVQKNPGDYCYYPSNADCVDCMVADFLNKVKL